jgi:hypothetical protein
VTQPSHPRNWRVTGRREDPTDQYDAASNPLFLCHHESLAWDKKTASHWHQENDVFFLWGNLWMLAIEFLAETVFLRENHGWTALKIQGAKSLAIELDC